MNVVDRIYELCAPLRNRGTEKDTRAIIEITVSYLKNCDEKLARTERALERCKEQRNHWSDARCDKADFAEWDAELDAIQRGEK